MKRHIAGSVLALGLVAASVTPAFAASDSGYKSCAGIMDSAVVTRGYGIGVQTHTQNGVSFKTDPSTTMAYRNVNMGYKTANWSVSAPTLDVAKTEAYCPA